MERILKGLGAEKFYELGEADEQRGLEEVVESWIDGLWVPLQEQLTLMQQREETEKVISEGVEPDFVCGEIIEKRVLTEENSQKKVVELRVSTEGNSYTAGTAISVYPQNEAAEVSRVLSQFNLDPDFLIDSKNMTPQSVHTRVSLPLSLCDFFTKFIDLHNPMSSRTASHLAEFLSPPDKEEFSSHIELSKLKMQEPWGLLHLSRAFSSWSLQVPEILSSLPVLSPRNYSISSTPLNSPESLTMAFTVTGVCTRYLDRVSEEPSAKITYTLPLSQGVFWDAIGATDEMLFISTGTGVSPFKGILEHLSLTVKSHS